MDGTMKKIYCNSCGKEIKMMNLIPVEDYIYVRKNWGYFSEVDGRTQEFVLCESCVKDMEEGFTIPSKWCDTTELL